MGNVVVLGYGTIGSGSSRSIADQYRSHCTEKPERK